MGYVDADEFVALTGCSYPESTILVILDAADKAVDAELKSLGNPPLDSATLHDASLLFAKALLADRYRFDGRFDASTIDYSHKGNSEQMIISLKDEARKLLQKETMSNITWIQKANR